MILETKAFNNTKNYMDHKEQSGIYAFIHNDKVIYVGQSVNIQQRLRQHRQATKNTHNRLYNYLRQYESQITFLVLPVEFEELDAKEEYYINKYKPFLNKIGVTTQYKPPKRYLW